MPSALGELLAQLAAALAVVTERWYLMGAQAAIVHGAARLTADVDVTVDLGATPTEELVTALLAHGFGLRVDDVDEFVASTRVLPVVHRASGMPVDIVLAGSGLEDEFFERTERLTVQGVEVPVACADDVIIMKVLAGRPTDMGDVAAILRARIEKLDLDHIRSRLGMLEEALGQADLLPGFEDAVEKACRR